MLSTLAPSRLVLFAVLALLLTECVLAVPTQSVHVSDSGRRCKRVPADRPKDKPDKTTDATATPGSSSSTQAPASGQAAQPTQQGGVETDALIVGSGSAYSTVSSAVAAAASKCSGSGGVTIVVNAGTYKEQVHITSSFPCKLTIKGASGAKPTITFNGARSPYASTATVSVESSKVVAMYNLHIENTFGRGAQAVALYANGQGQQAYYDCSFDGYQDTCFGGAAKTFFGRCSITGATDFIWGQDGIGWYENCKITVTSTGWVTADGRSSASSPGYIVLNKCSIDGSGKAQAYLGRPWGAYSRAVVQNSQIGGVIKSTGWDKWDNQDKPNAEAFEYGNTGEGAQGQRSNLKALSKPLSITEILGDTSWIDPAYLS